MDGRWSRPQIIFCFALGYKKNRKKRNKSNRERERTQLEPTIGRRKRVGRLLLVVVVVAGETAANKTSKTMRGSKKIPENKELLC